MSPLALTIAAVCYVTLAVAHSWLGERKLLRPLLAQPWTLSTLPRGFAGQLLRWAWHLTSVAWLAAAAILLGAAAGLAVPAPALDALAALAMISGVVILVPGRGAHPAWAAFFAGGVACLLGTHGWPGPTAARAAGASAALVLTAISALHVYWAVGGRRGLAAALPTGGDGARAFTPSAGLTVAVALALATGAALIASAAGWGPTLPWARELALAAAAVFGVRMIGDFRFVGLFKREHRTLFARWDSALYSPLCGALALACALAAW